MAMDNNLALDFQYFKSHHDEIFLKYPNKFVILKDCSVIMTGDSFEDAYTKAIDSGLEVGSFLVQECTEGEGAFTQTFHSRVVFA